MTYTCETCGEKLIHPPSPDYHEDYVVPGCTTVLFEYETSPMVRVFNDHIPGFMAPVPLSQIREASVRHPGERGPLVVSKWLARVRGWLTHGGQR